MRKIVLLFGFVLAGVMGIAQENEIDQNFDSNYVHTVFFWMKEPANEVSNKKLRFPSENSWIIPNMPRPNLLVGHQRLPETLWTIPLPIPWY